MMLLKDISKNLMGINSLIRIFISDVNLERNL